MIEYLCSVGDVMEEMNWRFSLLLSRVESIAHSHNCNNILVHVSNWREDTQTLLLAGRYEDIGGSLDESNESLSYTKPSITLSFMKKLKPLSSNTDTDTDISHTSSTVTTVKQNENSSSTSSSSSSTSPSDRPDNIGSDHSSLNTFTSSDILLRNVLCESITQYGEHSGERSGEHSLISSGEKTKQNKVIEGIAIYFDSHSSSHSNIAEQDCDLTQLDCNYNDIIRMNDNKKETIFDIQKNELNLNIVESSSSNTMEGIVSQLFSALQSDKEFNNN